MATVLLIDEDAMIRARLGEILGGQGHTCAHAADARDAFALLRGEADVILCAASAPGLLGGLLPRALRAAHPELPVIVTSAEDDPDKARAALAEGAHAFLLAPFRAAEVVITVENALRRVDRSRTEQRERKQLEELVVTRTEELRRTMRLLEQTNTQLHLAQEEIIHRLSIASEFRDTETGSHIYRMSRYSELLARHAGLGDERARLIRSAAPLHDVGKIGISDRILLKPGKHTPAEFERMKQHTTIGYQLLRGTSFELLNVAATIAWAHHERWDGSGYPRALVGEDIPVEGRIVAIADVFDALMTKRVYKPAFTVERSLELMREGRGAHFDPELLDVFVDHIDEVLSIRARFPDIASAEAFDFHRLPTLEFEALSA